MMHKDARELMRNTMGNLEFINRTVQGKSTTSESPFEVTQLVNSFLGALAHPWEELKGKSIWNDPKVHWPPISEVPKTSKRERVRLMRNAFAHGNLHFEGSTDIEQVTLWNTCSRGKCTWRATLSIADLEGFLDCFFQIANANVWVPKKVPADCGSLR